MVRTAAGDIVQHKPLLYQEVNGTRQEVPGNFVVNPQLANDDSQVISFDVGPYDRTRPLVIDPLVLGYSTFLGTPLGSDQGQGIAVDGAGNAYIVGYTPTTNFPTTPGAFDNTYNGNFDAFVVKP